MEVDENVLRHVFRLVRIGENTVRYPDDASVFGYEKGLECLVVRLRRGHPARPEVHAHCSSSTAGRRFVAPQ